MKIIDQTTLDEIEQHLLRLGAGNHSDNMNRLRRFEFHYSLELAEEDFLRLVFLQNNEVLEIVPRGYDRTLRSVAERAIKVEHPRLSKNWNLDENLRRMREKSYHEGAFREPLVICEARDGEEGFGPFYLQDGSHRALACASLILLREVQYQPQLAFCSMSNRMRGRLSAGQSQNPLG